MPYFEVNKGCQIHYERYGNFGPVLILLHGLASSSKAWKYQIRSLKKSYRVFVLDFPGHGGSDWQSYYSFQQEMEVIYQLMIHCNISKASLLAVSMGCTPALLFSAHYPEKVDKLILEGPVGGHEHWWQFWGFLDLLVFVLTPLMIEISIAWLGYHKTLCGIDSFGLKKKQSLKFIEASQCKTDYKAIRNLFWESACAPYATLLDRIKAPTLIIRGKHDPFPKRFVAYIYMHLKGSFYVEVENARHLISLENPHYFNTLVKKFLATDSTCRGYSSNSPSSPTLTCISYPGESK